MHVRVLYFAAVRELVGVEEEGLELPASVRTVGDFVAFVADLRPALAGSLSSVRIARNEVFADAGEALGEGDVLALIPPVAGG
jgi:molybdopterin synthase sulfur carrier subunit